MGRLRGREAGRIPWARWSFSYGFNIGYGGKVWHQDHLIIGAAYTDSVNGIGGSILELFLKYEFMYYHP